MHRISEMVRDHPGKKLIIAGCMPEVMGRQLRSIAPDASMVSTHNITRIAEAAERVAGGERVMLVGKTDEKKLCRPRARKNRLVGITELSQGCDGNCSYCCVRLAKGSLHCYSPNDIVKDVESALGEGCREVWLTSQDTAAYLFAGTRLPGLVDMICGMGGDFRVRIGMMDADNVIGISEDLAKAYKSEKVYKFLHLPVQSGSDRMLGLMRRKYKVSDFIRIVSKFRKSIPGITISTDVIVGFPGETPEDFRETVGLIERIRPDIVNVSKFGTRPGTEAAKMPPLDNRTIKERSRELSRIVRDIALERNKEWIGWEGPVLITGKGKREHQFMGRNHAYKPVLVESEKDLLGKTVRVKVNKAEVTHLESVCF
jgi:MiaB-like tRNA modifying enzyme